jgi:regulatory protein
MMTMWKPSTKRASKPARPNGRLPAGAADAAGGGNGEGAEGLGENPPERASGRFGADAGSGPRSDVKAAKKSGWKSGSSFRSRGAGKGTGASRSARGGGQDAVDDDADAADEADTPDTPFGKSDGPPGEDAVRGRALALLTRREHSRSELETKLGDWGAEPELIAAVLDELAARRLLDDTRFAEVFVRSRRTRGYGPVSIRQDLRQRGIGPELITAVLTDGEVDWKADAAAVRARRFGPAIPTDRKEQARQLRFLQYRGFNTAQAMASLKQAGEWEE